MKLSLKSGFTLIEIVISLAILAIGVLAVLALFPVGFDSASRSENLTKATIYAQTKMEDIKRLGYPVAAVTIATNFTSLDPNADRRFLYTVTTSDINPPGNLTLTTVRVSWTYKGHNYNEDFVTLIPSLGP